MSIPERLVAIREQHGYTRKRLAEELGKPYTTITKYETGEREPGHDYIVRIAKKFGVTTDYLLGVDDAPAASGVSAEALRIARDYDALPDRDRRLVSVMLDELRQEDAAAPETPSTKTIYLFGNSFAAGWGEPDFGNLWEDYQVPADSPADFAIRINGDSMEPYLADGSIALCRKTAPRDGDIAALLIDGEFLCKQVCIDSVGTLHLFSLNRARKNLDRDIPSDDIERQIKCFGTVIMKDHIPLPLD